MAVAVAGQTARGRCARWVLHQPPSASPSAVFLHTPGSMHNTPLLLYLLDLPVSLSALPWPNAQTLVFHVSRARLYPSLPSEHCRERPPPSKPSVSTLAACLQDYLLRAILRLLPLSSEGCDMWPHSAVKPTERP